MSIFIKPLSEANKIQLGFNTLMVTALQVLRFMLILIELGLIGLHMISLIGSETLVVSFKLCHGLVLSSCVLTTRLKMEAAML